jgi:hypothetical protein
MADIRQRPDELEQFRKQASEKLIQRRDEQAEVDRRRRDGRSRNIINLRRLALRPFAKPESDRD